MNKTIYIFSLLGFAGSIQAEEPGRLSPMTITATRTSQDTGLAATTLISRNDIERLQLRSVGEALRGLAGVNLANNGGRGKNTAVFLRGTESDHVLVLIDGIRAGSATSGTTAFEYLPIDEIESIEVIRGPRSSLYGSEALGGVIHIHTRRGADVPVRPAFSAGIGSHDHYQYSAGVSGEYQDSWYSVNLSHEETDGFNACDGHLTYGCFTNEPDADGFRNEAGSIRLGHKFADILSLQGHALYSNGDNHYDGNFVNQTDFVQQVVGGEARLTPSDIWTLTLQGGESRDRSLNRLNGIEQSSFNTRRLSWSAQNDVTLFDHHVISLGYDYLNDNIDSSLSFAVTSRDNHAVYSQYQGKFGDHQLLAGFREDFNQQFGNASTWNAGWGYAFDNGLSVSASYGTAFKAPTFNELYFPGFGSPDLRPERSRSVEIGARGQHSAFNWSISAFLTYIDSLIAYDSDLMAPRNLDKARIKGLELTADTRLYDFDIQANLSLLDPENRAAGADRGKLLPRRAQQVFRLDVDKRIGDFGLGGSILVEGRRFDNISNSRRIGGFATLDLRAEYHLFDQIRLQAKVNNILDKRYQTAAGYNQDRLNFFFSIQYTPIL